MLVTSHQHQDGPCDQDMFGGDYPISPKAPSTARGGGYAS